MITAHRAGEDDGHDWTALARMETLVVLMGVERLPHVVDRLLAHGAGADTPAAIVENGTLPTERVVVSTLGHLVADAAATSVRPPALIVIGNVVRLRASLAPELGAVEGLRETGPVTDRHVA